MILGGLKLRCRLLQVYTISRSPGREIAAYSLSTVPVLDFQLRFFKQKSVVISSEVFISIVASQDFKETIAGFLRNFTFGILVCSFFLSLDCASYSAIGEEFQFQVSRHDRFPVCIISRGVYLELG